MVGTCPKCGYAKVESGECLRCGVIVWKYQAYLERLDGAAQDRLGRADKRTIPAWCWIVTIAVFLAMFGHWALVPRGGQAIPDLSLKSRVVLRGDQAVPDFTLMSLDRQWVSLSDFQGRGVFLYFWATW